MTRPTELEKREEMLKEMFAEIGEGCYIEPPFLSETYKICAVHVLPGVFGMAHNKNAYIHRNSWLDAVAFKKILNCRQKQGLSERISPSFLITYFLFSFPSWLIAEEIVFSKASLPYLSTSALFFSPWVKQPAPPMQPPNAGHALNKVGVHNDLLTRLQKRDFARLNAVAGNAVYSSKSVMFVFFKTLCHRVGKTSAAGKDSARSRRRCQERPPASSIMFIGRGCQTAPVVPQRLKRCR